jgi:hypothetical protein
MLFVTSPVASGGIGGLATVPVCGMTPLLAKIGSRGGGGGNDDERVWKAFQRRSELASVKAIACTIWVLFLEIGSEVEAREHSVGNGSRGIQVESD